MLLILFHADIDELFFAELLFQLYVQCGKILAVLQPRDGFQLWLDRRRAQFIGETCIHAGSEEIAVLDL